VEHWSNQFRGVEIRVIPRFPLFFMKMPSTYQLRDLAGMGGLTSSPQAHSRSQGDVDVVTAPICRSRLAGEPDLAFGTVVAE
jgi:hypothetical protein